MKALITFDPPLDQIPMDYLWEFFRGWKEPECIGRCFAPSCEDALKEMMSREECIWLDPIYVIPYLDPTLRPSV